MMGQKDVDQIVVHRCLIIRHKFISI